MFVTDRHDMTLAVKVALNFNITNQSTKTDAISRFDFKFTPIASPQKNNPFLVFTYLLYKSFENTVGKGEIARNEQFLLFPKAFSPLSEKFPPFS